MSKTMTMTEARLRELLDCYGAEERRWPEAERAAARSLLTQHPDLDAERSRAAALDRLLAQAERPRASGALIGRLVEAAPRGRRRWLTDLWPFGPAWQPAFGLALALLLGLASGPLLPQSDTTQTVTQDSSQEIAVLLATPVYAEDSL
ncbi:hypothetical protein SAMN06265365_101445 [Tistlia consotensis]|uniref:Uncharacterized protein n=1 Tax=Tistlia consotensis USBA 355 TaxID=560819 RepID=A0A1Y6B915_9PROT|nr:hypothetical protein [Tistlia consotensis]SME91818.1 hypothetical protein SAMN05428998_101443 [Tistlia consotensis USBA 355]SNR27651.1 hypothetical protein SAMN06265365_101445 [Tistlia consotensis]